MIIDVRVLLVRREGEDEGGWSTWGDSCGKRILDVRVVLVRAEGER